MKLLRMLLATVSTVPSILLAVDTDGDGLDDSVETNTGIYVSPLDTGTAPNDPDTDGDGVGDWYEVANAGVPTGEPQPNSPNDPDLHPNTPYPLPAPDSSPTLATEPVKVYILAGQSNMDGHGMVSETNSLGTLTDIVFNGKKYPNLWNGSSWASRSDVYCRGLVATSANGPLVPGSSGASGGRFGPELGFGQQMGFYHDEPVLIIKVSQGNRTLGYDFLPPGSTEYASGSETYAGYGDSTKSWTTGTTPTPGSTYAGHQWDQSFLDDADWHVPPGTPYTNGIDVLDNFAAQYPQWASQGFEIAGFVWWQGYSDALSSVPYSSRYEQNMVRFINELRDYYEARYPGNISTDAPFVLGTLGFNGWSQSGVQLETTRAQLAVDGASGDYPEFANNVKTAETRGFYRNGSISPRTGQGHHYHLNAETYLLAGDALGRAMIDLQELGAAADTAEPQIAYLNPPDNASDVPGNMSLKITFKETVSVGSGDITIKNLTDNTQTVISVTDADQVSAAGFALTINPAADLETGDDYSILVDPGAVVDDSGNAFAGISGDTSWNFTASAPDYNAPPVPSFITPLGPKRNDEITVSVNAVTDPEGAGVVYRFRNVTLGRDSGWTVDTTWVDKDLPTGKIFAYTVQSRDNSLNLNESAVSVPVAAKTLSTDDPQVQVADVFTHREDFRPGDSVGDSQGVTGPITISTSGFEVGGTAKLVGVLSMHNSAATVATLTSLTFNGVDVLPNVITGFGSTGEVASEQYIFYLDSPPAAGDLVIGFGTSGGVDEVGVALFALNKVRPGYFARGENNNGNPPELDVYSGDFVIGVGKRNNQSQSVSNAPPYTSLEISAGNLKGFVGYITAGGDGLTAPVFSNTSISSSVAAFEAAPDPEPPLSAYETWAIFEAPLTANNPDGDEDRDGVSNPLEFVLGGTSSGNDIGKLPTLSTDGSSADFAFARAQQSIGPGVALQIEIGTDLVTWPEVHPVPDGATAGPPVMVIKDSSPGFDTVTLPVPMTPDATKFARLKVDVVP
ncbi:hypothetical protein HAHE_27420 [Haloferula helveola]|uniref:SbsA Ig-like domain-containing protein n=1 Tax=Haloferula helveola TaxID=490095 RepID=A0ABM7RM07_9BACT|nr:hypothetical protein HAHE_27420 [Haloferula helveola]